MQIEVLKRMKDYHAAEGLNRGLLLQLIHGPQAYLEMASGGYSTGSDLFYEEKESLIIGNAVECKVLLGDHAFNEAYYHPQLAEKPSDIVMSTMQRLYSQTAADRLDHIEDESITEAYEAEGYKAGTNWGAEAKMRNLKKEGEAYYNSLVLCKGRQLLSSEELVTIGVVADNLWASPRLQKYLKPEEGTECRVQEVIFFEYRGKQCKAMLDITNVNHEKKTARVIDLKTTRERLLNFPAAVRKWHYDLQIAFYTKALAAKYEGYEILPPVFLVASTTEMGAPLDFKMDMYDVRDLCDHRSRFILSLAELFNRLDWYETNGWDKHYMEHTGEPVTLMLPNIYGGGMALSLYNSPCPVVEKQVEAGITS